MRWPTDYRYPDVTFASTLGVTVGGVELSLTHARGETDDHLWVWVPDRKLLCTGDFFIWAAPNAGNPQKVQRFPLDWAHALRQMADLGAELMCPGHGSSAPRSAICRSACAQSRGKRWTFCGLPALGAAQMKKSPVQRSFRSGTQTQRWSSVSPRACVRLSSTPPTVTPSVEAKVTSG